MLKDINRFVLAFNVVMFALNAARGSYGLMVLSAVVSVVMFLVVYA